MSIGTYPVSLGFVAILRPGKVTKIDISSKTLSDLNTNAHMIDVFIQQQPDMTAAYL
jgi:hypothetical protein